jgi:hypothetical protein
MVIFRGSDGQPGYHQSEGLDEAVHFVERLRNGENVDQARIFKMDEVGFSFRPYFKVEIGDEVMPVDAPAAPEVTVVPPASEPVVVHHAVALAMEPDDADGESVGANGKRGLFGR